MREKWLALSERGQHFEVASLIRSLQIELAIEKITSMEREGVEVQDWLLELLYYSVAELGDVDEAFLIAKQRDRSGYSRSLPVMWFHLLERASKALHVRITPNTLVTQLTLPSVCRCKTRVGYAGEYITHQSVAWNVSRYTCHRCPSRRPRASF